MPTKFANKIRQQNSPTKFANKIHQQNSPTKFTNKIHQQNSPTKFTNKIHQQNSPTKFTNKIHQQNSPTKFTNKIHQQNSPTKFKECGAMPRNPLAGSERTPLPGARAVGKANPAERLEVTVVLRHRQHDALQERVRKITTGDKSQRHLTHDEYDHQFGAETADIQAVKKFAHQYGLTVVEEHQGRR